MGNYAYKASSKLLLGSKQDDASVANFDKKRFIYFEEPAFKQKLQSHLIKDMTGGNEVAARRLYSQDTCTKICATFALNTNNIPEFTQADDAIDDRLITYEWRSKFVKDKDEVNEMDNVYLADEDIGNKVFAQRYGSQLFNILCGYHQKYMNNNQQIALTSTQKRNNSDILKISDTFKSWFEENIVFTNDQIDFISLPDITQRFKISEYWLNLPTSMKQCGIKTYIKKQIMNRSSIKKWFRKEKVIARGIRGYKGYLIQHKFKSNSILNEYHGDVPNQQNTENNDVYFNINELNFDNSNNKENGDVDDQQNIRNSEDYFNNNELNFDNSNNKENNVYDFDDNLFTQYHLENNNNEENDDVNLENNAPSCSSSSRKKRLKRKRTSTDLDYPAMKKRKLN